MLNNIVDNLEQYGQHNIAQCCFHQARTGCAFFAVYWKPPVRGCHLEFARQPVQSVLPKSPPFNQAGIQIIDTEVEELLLKRAVTRVAPCKEEFISIVFLVPKKTGDMRPVI